ncbi:hypothetical protein AVHY2522_24465 [Acidovorax sp. SUPP2522]|nr:MULTISPECIES: DUF6538 domain-containing protein [unclassified Acidovorax]WCM95646.1 hypothetical protein M5C96_14255 [Acidovorax sp. GBBC 1281]GKT19986.1 hypothetical protein AVHY2522_24465 [Acidovorax sp. SUPP2522]
MFYLHTRVGKKQFKRSLGTRDPQLAKLRALDYLRAIAMGAVAQIELQTA